MGKNKFPGVFRGVKIKSRSHDFFHFSKRSEISFSCLVLRCFFWEWNLPLIGPSIFQESPDHISCRSYLPPSIALSTSIRSTFLGALRCWWIPNSQECIEIKQVSSDPSDFIKVLKRLNKKPFLLARPPPRVDLRFFTPSAKEIGQRIEMFLLNFPDRLPRWSSSRMLSSWDLEKTLLEPSNFLHTAWKIFLLLIPLLPLFSHAISIDLLFWTRERGLRQSWIDGLWIRLASRANVARFSSDERILSRNGDLNDVAIAPCQSVFLEPKVWERGLNQTSHNAATKLVFSFAGA